MTSTDFDVKEYLQSMLDFHYYKIDMCVTLEEQLMANVDINELANDRRINKGIIKQVFDKYNQKVNIQLPKHILLTKLKETILEWS